MNDFLNLAFEGFGVQVNKCLVQLVKLLKTALQIGQPCSGFEKVRGQCFGAGARRTLMASSCRAISCSVQPEGVADPANASTPLQEKIALRRQALETFLAQFTTSDAFSAFADRHNLAWGHVRSGVHCGGAVCGVVEVHGRRADACDVFVRL